MSLTYKNLCENSINRSLITVPNWLVISLLAATKFQATCKTLQSALQYSANSVAKSTNLPKKERLLTGVTGNSATRKYCRGDNFS